MIDRAALEHLIGEILADPSGRDAAVEADAILALDTREPFRYFEAAVIAVEDAYRDQQFDPGLMLQRGQVLATLASAEQARIANLIAWKQLQATRAATRDLGVDLMPLSTTDAATDEIERVIGLEP